MHFPDPLLGVDGAVIASASAWHQQRAPELRRLFEENVYGLLPQWSGPLTATLRHQDRHALGGIATIEEIELVLEKPQLTMRLVLAVPVEVDGPVPCFLGYNYFGNHTVVDDPAIALPRSWTNPKDPEGAWRGAPLAAGEVYDENTLRGSDREAWGIEESVRQGFAVATLFSGDLVPDHPLKARPALARLGHPHAPSGSESGTVAVWAWGLQLLLGYLASDPRFNPHGIGYVGHSRYGKAAVLAGAFDPRPAFVAAVQAGIGGTAPSRVDPALLTLMSNCKPMVETAAAINAAFPHWFCSHYAELAAEPDMLPVDQHELMALCAPTPLIIMSAAADLWTNPAGQFQMLCKADPVYRLIAGEGLSTATMPPLGELTAGRLAYFVREGTHAMQAQDWQAIRHFAGHAVKLASR